MRLFRHGPNCSWGDGEISVVRHPETWDNSCGVWGRFTPDDVPDRIRRIMEMYEARPINEFNKGRLDALGWVLGLLAADVQEERVREFNDTEAEWYGDVQEE